MRAAFRTAIGSGAEIVAAFNAQSILYPMEFLALPQMDCHRTCDGRHGPESYHKPQGQYDDPSFGYFRPNAIEIDPLHIPDFPAVELEPFESWV